MSLRRPSGNNGSHERCDASRSYPGASRGAKGSDGPIRRPRRLDLAWRAARPRGGQAGDRRGDRSYRRRHPSARRSRQGSRRRRRPRLLRRTCLVRGRCRAGASRGIDGVETRLVGRERELGLAEAALERTLGGSGGVLFISGDAGIGKSRLVAELCRTFEESETAAAAPPLWLEGRCISYGESLPYWPFRDLLRDWLGVGADEPELRVRVALRRRVEGLFPQRAAELYPYLGSLLGLTLEADAVARLAELSPEALQYRTFEVVEELFRRLAEDRPVAVAIEDLHWADPTSIQLVERLVSIGEEAAVLLVIAQRSERDHPSWRLRERAPREYPHLASEVALEPLPGDAQRELLLALVGEDTLPEELRNRLLEQAEGNPFYLEELVRSLADTGALVHANGDWRFDHEGELQIPPP